MFQASVSAVLGCVLERTLANLHTFRAGRGLRDPHILVT